MPDYCTIVSRNSRLNLTGPIIAVELKPKRGFLSPKTSFSKNFQFKANVCKFALKQHAKVRVLKKKVQAAECLNKLMTMKSIE